MSRICIFQIAYISYYCNFMTILKSVLPRTIRGNVGCPDLWGQDFLFIFDSFWRQIYRWGTWLSEFMRQCPHCTPGLYFISPLPSCCFCLPLYISLPLHVSLYLCLSLSSSSLLFLVVFNILDLLWKKQEYFEGLLVFNGENVTLFNMFSSIAYIASFINFFKYQVYDPYNMNLWNQSLIKNIEIQTNKNIKQGS